MVLVLQACSIFRHHLHILYQNNIAECHLCSKDTSALERAADQAIDIHASLLTERVIPKNKLAEKFRLSGEVWLSQSRLEKEGEVECQDLDCIPFFDHQNIKRLPPIIHVSLDIFHSYLVLVHEYLLPHMGVEATLREIRERFHPVGNARAVIHNYKSHCTHCRITMKKIVDMELAQYPAV